MCSNTNINIRSVNFMRRMSRYFLTRSGYAQKRPNNRSGREHAPISSNWHAKGKFFWKATAKRSWRVPFSKVKGKGDFEIRRVCHVLDVLASSLSARPQTTKSVELVKQKWERGTNACPWLAESAAAASDTCAASIDTDKMDAMESSLSSAREFAANLCTFHGKWVHKPGPMWGEEANFWSDTVAYQWYLTLSSDANGRVNILESSLVLQDHNKKDSFVSHIILSKWCHIACHQATGFRDGLILNIRVNVEALVNITKWSPSM
jgi:hypothetical protein